MEAIVVFLEQNKVLPKKRISLVLIFPFPRISPWMSHLKTIDAYPFSDPPPLADHGNILAWRADPQSNHWRHQCHQLIINTTKKIDFTIIVKNILKKLFPNLTINHHLMKPLPDPKQGRVAKSCERRTRKSHRPEQQENFCGRRSWTVMMMLMMIWSCGWCWSWSSPW